LAVFGFAEAPFDLLPLPVRPAALLFVAVVLIAILLIPFGPRHCEADTTS
jgi:hypothetical protein